MRWLAWALMLGGPGAVVVTILGLQGPAPREFGPPQPKANLDDPAVNESSGLAASLRYADHWLTHNDSGDGPRFFRFDPRGKVRDVVTLKGADAVDWEDAATARVGGRNLVYLGDVGDNARRRASVTVYRLEEPDAGTTEVATFDRVELTFPDGPQNCETLMVHPQTGDIWLVAKVDRGASGVYRARAPRGSGKVVLRRMGEITVGTAVPGSQMITGGDISPDGRFVVVRSYMAAHEYRVEGSFDDWFRGPSVRVGLAVELQGEAIAYARNGRSLVTTSEGVPCPVSAVSIRP